MVQLEHRSGFPEWLQKYAFQFHYGSIRTQVSMYRSLFLISLSIPLWFNQNLNCLFLSVRFLSTFNSIMVQLELRKTNLILIFLFFQFHYGSIRTAPDFKDGDKFYAFNSIMVQLEQVRRCKLGLQYLLSIPLWFNQNIIIKSADSATNPFFQFHYGSIRT